MLFNPYPSKPTHEVFFSRKRPRSNQQGIYFDNFKVKKRNIKNMLGMVLEEKLIFKYHIEKVIYKVNKVVLIIRKPFTIFVVYIMEIKKSEI